MAFQNTLSRKIFAILLLLAQTVSGGVRVVHCHDDHCRESGVYFECHSECEHVHSSGSQLHDRCVETRCCSAESQLPREEVACTAEIRCNSDCGQGHHHHFVSSGDADLPKTGPAVEEDSDRGIAIATWAIGLLTLSNLRSDHLSRCNLAASRPIPLEMRLRI